MKLNIRHVEDAVVAAPPYHLQARLYPYRVYGVRHGDPIGRVIPTRQGQ
jgi:hypothetical protein